MLKKLPIIKPMLFLNLIFLSGVCSVVNADSVNESECSFDQKEHQEMKDLYSHYSRIHDRIGVQCDYKPSIELSNKVDKKITAFKVFEDTCLYNPKQLKAVFIEYGEDLYAQSFYRHFPYDLKMGIVYESQPKEKDKYSYYYFDHKDFYLINEEHIKCESLNLEEIENLKKNEE